MSLTLTTQKELRRIQDLGFCYLCGTPWERDAMTNRDHIPPRRLFAETDRTPPLILRTHVRCNNGHSLYDEQIGQLVSLLWKKSPGPPDVSSLRVSMHTAAGMATFGAIEWLNVRFIIARWLKGFHAALYGEFLPSVNGAIHEPFPGGDTLGEDTNLHVSHPVFVREIKKNRVAGKLDSIVIYNGKCRYECSWSHLDDGRPMCLWALDLYGWLRLGDTNNFPARSCVGWYEATNGIPDGAARATKLELPIRNTEPLNAFEGVR
jgi:hypothetical protein